MSFVALGIGSNAVWQGKETTELLREAVLTLCPVLSGIRWSSVYRTKPMYVTDQQDFLNMVVTGSVGTGMTARMLLDHIHSIEASFGRNRSREIRNGPRPLDIDIELFGSQVIHEPDLEIPHPRIAERAFVLVPLLEILPESADGIDRRKYESLLEQLPDQGVRMVLPADQFITCTDEAGAGDGK